MLKIDSHQHFWQYNPVRDRWITDEMSLLRRDFLPGDFLPEFRNHEIGGCIAVQADPSEKETAFLLALSDRYPFIKGVVGWIDLQDSAIEERLVYYRRFRHLKGFRHLLQDELDPGFMLGDRFCNGISLLHKYGFTFDLLIRPQQLKAARQLVNMFPEQRFVVDHMAKPLIREKQLIPWQNDLAELSKSKNVWCKVSGLLTEADWNHADAGEFEPYLDVVFREFDSSRLMFGSDWPVCTLAGGYDAFTKVLQNHLKRFNDHEQALFWGRNAVNFYRIEINT